jgi:hypothetical protein
VSSSGIYFYIYCENYYFSFCTRTVTYRTKTEKWVCTGRDCPGTKPEITILTINVKVNSRRRHVCRNLLYIETNVTCLLWIKKTRGKDKTYIWVYECRYDERLQTKSEKSTRLVFTGLFGELEHLKIETMLIDEMFPSVMGEYRIVHLWIAQAQLLKQVVWSCKKAVSTNWCIYRPHNNCCLLWIDEAKANIKPIYECRCNERL